MGSNSSTIQQQTIQNITTEVGAAAIVNANATCVQSGFTIVSTCPVKITNACFSSTQVDSTVTVEQTVAAVMSALTTQSAQNGMFRFLNFNSQTTEQQVRQYINTNVQNKCEVSTNVTAIQTGLNVLITKRPCTSIGKVTLSNVGENRTSCTLNTAVNLFANAELNATVDQQSGGFGGSSGDGDCAIGLIILVIVFLFIGIVMIFFFKNKIKKAKKSKKYKKGKKLLKKLSV